MRDSNHSGSHSVTSVFLGSSKSERKKNTPFI